MRGLPQNQSNWERMNKFTEDFDEVQLGEDEYFVLGDNRNHSSDSRVPNVGVLKREDLVGRAWVRIWPLNNLGVVAHGEKN